MISYRTRREFLGEVGRGVLTAAVGSGIATELNFSSARADEAPRPLSFGALEPLVCLMQETPADRLLPALVAELRSGTDLRKLTAAAALAPPGSCLPVSPPWRACRSGSVCAPRGDQ